jgi:uncharacterized protein (DUF2336 family)
MPENTSLMSQLEDVVQHGTPQKRNAMLNQITMLFLEGASQFNEEHVHLFDDLFGRLTAEIEEKARAELSRRLAPIGNAPLELMRRLAKDDDIAIAGPVLLQSSRLAADDLLAIATSKSQAHLFAISGRAGIDEAVTDVLVRRGDREVVRKLASNPRARLSESGYSSMIKRAEKDGVLAETVAQRSDIPDHLFRELLTQATDVVQRRLLAAAKPETQAEIRRVLMQISDEVNSQGRPKRDYSQSVQTVRKLAASGKLGEKQLAEFAKAERYEETVAALGQLSSVPIEVIDRLMCGERPDPILILCKAVGFEWDTVREIIVARPGGRGKSDIALDTALANFDKLSASTAQRVVRFWQAA